MHTLRQQLLKIQRRLYLRNLRRIEETLAPDPALESYSREYHKYLKQYESVSSTYELIRHVTSSDVVYHGDYHPLKQSQIQEYINRAWLGLLISINHQITFDKYIFQYPYPK